MTTQFKELQLDTTLSLAVIATGLVVSWFGYAVDSTRQQAARIAAEDTVTVSQDDGRYKMTVTAQRPRDFVPVSDARLTARPTPATS